MGCATSIVKYLVFLFNFIFVLAGIAFIVVGALIKFNVKGFDEILEKLQLKFEIAPILMIIVGCIVFVIAFFGCCGAIKESTCLLTTYAVILLVILIAQVAVGIYAFIQTKESTLNETNVSSEFRKLMAEYQPNEPARETIDLIQKELQCCGADSKSDWKLSELPKSCCGRLSTDPQSCKSSEAFSTGCGQALYDALKKSFNIIGIVIIVIAAIELFGAIFALCLSSSIKNNERRGHYA